MTNMSYCRFQNTASDLADCEENWVGPDEEESDLSEEEQRAKKRIVRLCRSILEMENYEVTSFE